MKVTLISPYDSIDAIGIRIISSCLKKEGHDVQMIFLQIKGYEEKVGHSKIFSQDTLSQISALCSESRVVCISLMSIYVPMVIEVVEELRKITKATIVVGGVHPTLRPEESLAFSDIVCVGEGEKAVVELINRMEKGGDICNIDNLWFKKEDGSIIKNKLSPLEHNLDEFPFPDYDLSKHYIYDQKTGAIKKMDSTLLERHLDKSPLFPERGSGVVYRAIATRGCLYSCTFCCNNSFKKIYKGQKMLRRRSIGNVIDELTDMKKRYDFIKIISLVDDCFLDAPLEEIKEFSKIYKEKVGLPFFCLGTPHSITKEKIEILLDAGLTCVQIGIQTGSPEILRMYKRPFSNEGVKKAATILSQFKGRMLPPMYDIIIDNPFENMGDVIKTLRFLVELPTPYFLTLFSLVFMPDTELYNKAMEKGLIKDDKDAVWEKTHQSKEKSYLTFMFSLINTRMPRFVIKFLLSDPMVALLNRKFFNKIFNGIYNLFRTFSWRYRMMHQ